MSVITLCSGRSSVRLVPWHCRPRSDLSTPESAPPTSAHAPASPHCLPVSGGISSSPVTHTPQRAPLSASSVDNSTPPQPTGQFTHPVSQARNPKVTLRAPSLCQTPRSALQWVLTPPPSHVPSPPPAWVLLISPGSSEAAFALGLDLASGLLIGPVTSTHVIQPSPDLVPKGNQNDLGRHKCD